MTDHVFAVDRNEETGIARITLDRPDRLNRFPHAARYELSAAIEDLARTNWMRVLIIDAAGEKAFSVGVDINELLDMTPTQLSSLYQPMGTPERIPQPVIAAIDGHCYGGPFEMTLACDFRIVTERARIGLPEVRLGQMPGSGGGQRLLRLIGPTRAKLMCMTGKVIDGRTAEAWGLATTCVEPSQLAETVDGLAAELAGLAPPAVQMIKRALNAGADASLPTALEMEGKMYATLKTTRDYVEGLAAWQEKRTPQYRGE
jgi:2-oxoglutaroyl-CoA hydrolase